MFRLSLKGRPPADAHLQAHLQALRPLRRYRIPDTAGHAEFAQEAPLQGESGYSTGSEVRLHREFRRHTFQGPRLLLLFRAPDSALKTRNPSGGRAFLGSNARHSP